MTELYEEGSFRGRIIEYWWCPSKTTSSRGVGIKVEIDEYWHAETQQWGSYEGFPVVSGVVWIIGTDGVLNQRQVQSLTDHAGWNGDFDSISDGTWKPTPVQVKVGTNERQGNTEYRIDWVNAYDSIPGGSGLNAETAKELNAKYGSQLRALRGNVTRNAAPPAGSEGPKKPAAKAKQSTEQPTPVPDKTGDEIPF
ncbi:hypothetical protein LCGC14_1731980 [marine sediment metagenome]|uniref:Uncharacterized protein n=1 Tax=marine sediment metagenome TaxID=412755 RepID=A0A0F9H928_9ZZZZ